MFYRVIDCQLGNYFHGGYIFKTKEEIREDLADYHAVDWTYERGINTLTLEELQDYGEWDIEEVPEDTPQPDLYL